MFYIIGLGLGDPKDITVKGLEIIRKCDRVYLEAYTSVLISGQIENLVSGYSFFFFLKEAIELKYFIR
jgi:diphthamide biosynthesis methyltransferase